MHGRCPVGLQVATHDARPHGCGLPITLYFSCEWIWRTCNKSGEVLNCTVSTAMMEIKQRERERINNRSFDADHTNYFKNINHSESGPL